MSITLTIERVTDYSHILAALETNGLPKSIIYMLTMFYFRKWFSSNETTDGALSQLFKDEMTLKHMLSEEFIGYQESFPQYLLTDRGLTSMARAIAEIHSFYEKYVTSLRQSFQYAHMAKYGFHPHSAVVVLDVRLSGWYLTIN